MKPDGNVERLAALIDARLADSEARAAGGEIPSAAELNALRRLIVWQERELSLRELLSSPETAERA